MLKQLLLNTLLINSAKTGNIRQITLWLELGANINYANAYRWTALIKAATNGHTYVVKKLLDLGADINATDADGLGGALFMAVAHNHADTVKLLLHRGADVNISNPIHNLTPLNYACIYSIIDVVILLLQHPNINRSIIVAELIIGTGAANYPYLSRDTYIKRTALVKLEFAYWHLIQSVWNSITDSILLETAIDTAYSRGVSIDKLSNSRNNNGLTLLGYAIKSNNLKTLYLLLNKNINPLIHCNLNSVSIGLYAKQCGNLLLSEQLYYKTLKAMCKRDLSLNQLRSYIIIGNSVNLPKDLVHYILTFL
jgi:ankyrin repeat protein